MNEEFDYEIETYEYPVETVSIRRGDLVCRAADGAVDIAIVVPEAAMEAVVRSYLERNPHWLPSPAAPQE